ncbi:MAG TPA: thiamine phosphate synthase [Candidatus Binataceae bacterium]|nr:thiamine phosphate synthase [Candidatus Binataceae bacterium]
MPSQFYAMVDTAGGHEPVALAQILLDAGVRVLQLRLKDAGSRDFLAAAREIARRCRPRGAMLIVNDRADIARLAEADGVHVGQDDLPLEAARAIIGEDRIVGVSTHSIEQARAAEAGGADYIGFGAIYSGGLKNVANAQGLERLRAVRAAVAIPIVAIGGITETSLPEVLDAGADAAAIITDVVRAPDIAAKVIAIMSIRARG